MTNFIEHIRIKNFKSIKDCEISGCKRINLFIGRPNVGKSNILEALSLLSIPYLRESTSKKLSNLLRIEYESELFYKGEAGKGSLIETDIATCILEFAPKEYLAAIINVGTDTYYAKIDDKLSVRSLTTKSDFDTRIKKYTYKQDISYKKGHAKYLIPPYGSNLLSIIEHYDELKQDVIRLFKDSHLDIVFDKASQTIKIIHSTKDGIFLIPYNSIADTLQRIIFYKAAIASNDNSILLFEEPEAHSFPPYMTHLTQEMIYKKDNQFFVATHSPFILNDLLENAQDELAVFIVHLNREGTQLTHLSKEDLHNAYQNGVDFFTNSESFI